MDIAKKYSKEIEIAEQNGWTVDLSRVHHNGPMFTLGPITVWKIREGWQCADMVDGHYRNHRSSTNLVSILEKKGG